MEFIVLKLLVFIFSIRLLLSGFNLSESKYCLALCVCVCVCVSVGGCVCVCGVRVYFLPFHSKGFS